MILLLLLLQAVTSATGIASPGHVYQVRVQSPQAFANACMMLALCRPCSLAEAAVRV